MVYDLSDSPVINKNWPAPQPKLMVCKICKNQRGNRQYLVREMMFGFRDKFTYFECALCGCLQIKSVPKNLSKYYPKNYYSFKKPKVLIENPLKTYFRRKRTNYLIHQKDIIGQLVSVIQPIKSLPKHYIWLRKCQTDFKAKILDVGCGAGHLLLALKWEGFKNLLGIDPYLKDDITYDNGVSVLKKEFLDIQGKYDLLMFHHSFEHLPEPRAVFKNIFKLLNNQRYAIIRVPIVSSYAWKHYGVNWVQIDAPRHFFLPSLKSLEILSAGAGLKIKEVVFDSTEFQFWGSEQYLRDIPLKNYSSYNINPKMSIFSQEEIKSFRIKAAKLNKEKFGDQACCYLYKE